RKAAGDIKTIFVEMARSRLPNLISKIYIKIIIFYLTYLDKNNKAFNNNKEFKNKDRILIKVRYIKKVIL
ncbi:hypothetical protein BKA65DRAFT_390694, partial [Rhexocercosporidium sp. MPI-PUGE-AT-0058]